VGKLDWSHPGVWGAPVPLGAAVSTSLFSGGGDHEAHPQVQRPFPLGGERAVGVRRRVVVALDLQVEHPRPLQLALEVQRPHAVPPHHLKVAQVVATNYAVLDVSLQRKNTSK
jgi:hypothetical protein